MIGFRLFAMNRATGAVTPPPVTPTKLRIAVANAGDPNNSLYTLENGAITKTASAPFTPSNANASDVVVSPDGQYLAVVTGSATAYLRWYKRVDEGNWTELALPATMITGAATSAGWSPDGQYLAVGHYTAPFLTVYKRSGDTLTKIPDSPTAFSNRVQGMGWHPTQNVLALAGLFAGYCGVVSISDSGVSALTTAPASGLYYSYGARFSPKGDLVGFVSQASPYSFIYPWTGSGFGTKLAGTVGLSAPRSIVFGKDSTFFYMSGTASPYLAGWKIENGAITTALPTPTDVYSSFVMSLDMTPDDKYLVTTHCGSPFLTAFEKQGDNLVKLPAPDVTPANNGAAVHFYRA